MAISAARGVTRSGKASRPSMTKRPICAIQPIPFDERAGRGAVRQLNVPQDQRADIHGGEPAGVDECGDAVREHRPDQDREWIEPRGWQCDAPQNLRTEPAKTATDRQAADELEHDQAEQPEDAELHRIADCASELASMHEQHSRRIIEAGLGFQRSAQRVRDGNIAEHREDRRSIGRGRDRAQQHRNPERQSEDVVPEQGHQADADPDANRGQQCRQDGRGPDVAPLGGETALGQDHHQRGKAECLRKIGIVEGDSDAGFAHHHAETEEQQQRRAGRPERRSGRR